MFANMIANYGFFNMEQPRSLELAMDFNSLKWWSRYRDGLKQWPVFGEMLQWRFAVFWW